MEIRIRKTGAVVMESEFRAMFPNTSLPVPLNEQVINDFGGDVVFEGAQATTTPPYEISMRQGVEQVGGKWYTKYVVGPVFTDYTDEEGILHTAAEQESAYKAAKDAARADAIRAQRTDKLNECDWTQLPDAPVDKTAWAAYRQQLRDITKQVGFPWEVKWPDMP